MYNKWKENKVSLTSVTLPLSIVNVPKQTLAGNPYANPFADCSSSLVV